MTIVTTLLPGTKETYHITKKMMAFLKVDLSKHNNLNKIVKGNDFVFHLTRLLISFPALKNQNIFKTNVEGTFKLLNACKDLKIRKFIYSVFIFYGIPKNILQMKNLKLI